jgi:hypothetical protein
MRRSMSAKRKKSRPHAPWQTTDPPAVTFTHSFATTSAEPSHLRSMTDAYFSADVETDGPIPGPFSMLSFALVYVGTFDGHTFDADRALGRSFYAELKPISSTYEQEALDVNGIDRHRLQLEGEVAADAMTRAAEWVQRLSDGRRPILVAYPLSFDWTFLYWYFTAFSALGSPFNHSGCFDLKTAFAAKAGVPISWAGRDRLLQYIQPEREHTHHALDDARQQAELFIDLFVWRVHE